MSTAAENDGYQEALKRIAQAKAGQSEKLDLNGLGLEKIPPEIAELTHLKEVSCGENHIEDLNSLSSLSNLTGFYCSSNQIRDLGPLSGLTQLTVFFCDRNQIEDLGPLSGLTLLTTVLLHGNQIMDLSPLSGLIQLTSVYCGWNQITDLSPLSGLTQLTKVSCWGNQIADLSPLRNLTRLTVVDFNENQITDLSPLSGLTKLSEVDCSVNQIEDLSLLRNLTGLTVVDFSENQIMDLGPLGGLTGLIWIDCHSNRIKDTQAIQLLLDNNKNLKKVDFSDNLLTNIPVEFLNNVEQLRSYFASLKQGSERNTQLKMLLLGNGRVGKSSLAHCLEHDEPAPEQMQSTHGILVKNLEVEIASSSKPWQVSLWDFGGQEIYHATHRLFYSHNALFLVVWAEDPTEIEPEEYKHNLIYWLDLARKRQIQENQGDILIVKNCFGQSNQLGINLPELNEAPYNQYRHYAVNARTFDEVPIVQAAIKQALKGMEARREDIPSHWIRIRERLLNDKRHYIAKTEFEDWCGEVNEASPDTLLMHLHHTGNCLYFAEHMGQNIILDQNWAIQAIYKFFDSDFQLKNPKQRSPRLEIENNDGELKGERAKKLLKEYKAQEVEMFFDFMLGSELCFELTPDSGDTESRFNHKTFVFPSLLKKDHAELDIYKFTCGLAYRYHFPWLHRLMVERFIIAANKLAPRKTWWRNGITFFDSTLNAFGAMEADSEAKTISFYLVAHDLNSYAKLLERIKNTLKFDDLCDPLSQEISLNLSAGWVDVKKLENARKSGRQEVETTVADRTVSVSELYRFIVREDARKDFDKEHQQEPSLDKVAQQVKSEQAPGNIHLNINLTNQNHVEGAKVENHQHLANHQQDIQALINELNQLGNRAEHTAEEAQNIQEAKEQLTSVSQELAKPTPNKLSVNECIEQAEKAAGMVEKAHGVYQKLKPVGAALLSLL